MALQFIDNFYPYGEVASQLSAANSAFNTEWIENSGGLAAHIDAGFHPGSKSLRLDRSTTNFSTVSRWFSTEEDVAIVGFAFKATDRQGVIFSMENTGQDKLVELKWDNEFEINDVKGDSTILLNRVYFVEVKITKSTKEVVLQVNGYPYLESTFTEDATDDIMCTWGFHTVHADDSASMQFSDVYFVDSAAGKFTDFMGAHRVISREVTAEVGDGWSPEPDTMSRLDIVSAIPANASQFTESDEIGAQDFYLSDNEIDENAVINGVAVTTLITKTDIDTQFISMGISRLGEDKLSKEIYVPTEPEYKQAVFETDVADEDWTPESVLDTAFGPVIVLDPDKVDP